MEFIEEIELVTVLLYIIILYIIEIIFMIHSIIYSILTDFRITECTRILKNNQISIHKKSVLETRTQQI